MTSITVADRSVPAHYVGATQAAVGATLGAVAMATFGTLVPATTPHRGAIQTAMVTLGVLAGAALSAPPSQRLGAALGSAAGMGAFTALGAPVGAPAWWLRLPAMAAAVPAGTFAGAVLQGR